MRKAEKETTHRVFMPFSNFRIPPSHFFILLSNFRIPISAFELIG